MPIRLELRKDAGKFDGYAGPWVRRRQVGRVLGPPDPAAIAELVSHRGETLGFGLYSPESAIPLRLLCLGETPPPEDWLERRIAAALGARAALGMRGSGGPTTGFREINSEGDGLPGLVVDRFERWRVIQITTAPMAARLDAITAALSSGSAAEGLDGTIALSPEAAAEREGFPSIEVVTRHGPGSGEGPPDKLRWREAGRVMEAPAPPAQKTGAYHDQRENRGRFAALAAASPSSGAILDLGCHVGGFAVAAALATADQSRPIVAVDRSAEVLEWAAQNAAANGLEPARLVTVRADMFGALDDERLAGPFSAVIFDPPKIASSRRDLGRALQALARTSATLLRRLEPAGLLVLCSCSHHLGVPELDRTISIASARAGRPCARVALWGPGPDHPVGPGHDEGEYLRVAVYQRR